jgi:hypothetical protein
MYLGLVQVLDDSHLAVITHIEIPLGYFMLNDSVLGSIRDLTFDLFLRISNPPKLGHPGSSDSTVIT